MRSVLGRLTGHSSGVDLPGEGVTSDTDGQRLTETDQGGLVDGFVCEARGETSRSKHSSHSGNPEPTHVPDLETTPILPWLKI